jgi:uncharacterized protein (DUF2062 family)
MSEKRNERELFKIMSFSTALGFGVLGAFLYSLRDIGHDVSFDFTVGTVVVFCVCAAAGWGFWRYIFAMSERDRARRAAEGDETKNPS